MGVPPLPLAPQYTGDRAYPEARCLGVSLRPVHQSRGPCYFLSMASTQTPRTHTLRLEASARFPEAPQAPAGFLGRPPRDLGRAFLGAFSSVRESMSPIGPV